MDNRNVFLLNAIQIDCLREKLLDLLADKGARIDHDMALEALAGSGAVVDKAAKTVRFPRRCLEELIDPAPREILLAATDPAYDLKIPRAEGGFFVRTATGAPGFLDPVDGSYRRTRLSDVASWARLTGNLEYIDCGAYPSPVDIPARTADIHALGQMLLHCPKHIWVQPYSTESIPYLFRMAEVAAGGELHRRPLVSMIACSLTPLDFKYMDLEIIVQACRRGVPVHACSLPAAGGTAPVTMAGTVLLACAEVLVLLAAAQALQPGTSCIATPLIFSMDMLTGRSLQASTEAIQGAAASGHFLRTAFNIPVHTYGFGADSPEVDGQAQAERALLALTVALAGVDILGGAGQVETATTISPLQLIIDNDLASMVRKIYSGVPVSDKTLAWEELLEVRPGGHFLSSNHTFTHCRDAYKSQTFRGESRVSRKRDGAVDQLSRAKEIFERSQDHAGVSLLSAEAGQEIKSLLEDADRLLR